MEIDSTIAALQKTFAFTMDRVDDWQNVVPEGEALRSQCEVLQEIIKRARGNAHLPIANLLKDVDSTMTETNKLIKTFMAEDALTDRSFWASVEWQFRRMFLAWDHRQTFKTTLQYLKDSKAGLLAELEFADKMNKPTAHWYKADMVNDKCFDFWLDLCGVAVVASWEDFMQGYLREFKVDWNADTMERIRRVACRDSSRLAISGYINLTNLCGFPLRVDELPKLIDTHATVSTQTRMAVAKMINELITYYSTKEMRDLIVSLFTWYKGCNKRDTKAWQDRANEWAHVILDNRGKRFEDLSERGQLAEQVDMARRTYSFFFQRYMVVFKIGQLSKEMFSDVDFPGKARMYEFIDHVKPLDHANYHIVIRGKESEWDKKQPKVYKFLRDFMANEKEEKEAKKKAAEAAAKEKAAAADLEKNAAALDIKTALDVGAALDVDGILELENVVIDTAVGEE